MHTPAYLHYEVLAHGQKPLLAFHGFGQDRRVFAPLAAALTGHYTFYACDLFFHGQSRWDEHAPLLLTAEAWAAVIADILQREGIDRFALCGFSMGGRLAMELLAHFGERIDALWLIAPDGVQPNPWYSTFTTVPPFNRLFRAVAYTRSDVFPLIVRVADGLRLVPRTVLRLAASQMRTPAQRQRVYQTWMLYRKLRSPLSQTAHLIRQYCIPVYLFAGKYDRIVPLKQLKKLKQAAPAQVQYIEPTCGHNRLIVAAATWATSQRADIHDV